MKASLASHWRLINAGEYEAAFDLFSPGFQARVSREGWVADKLHDLPVASTLKFSSVSVNGDRAGVGVSVETVGAETSSTNTGCNDWTGTYHLVGVDGQWLIDGSTLERTPC